ncbi:unnamed protein product, partial [marine sediment metagenome]
MRLQMVDLAEVSYELNLIRCGGFPSQPVRHQVLHEGVHEGALLIDDGDLLDASASCLVEAVQPINEPIC